MGWATVLMLIANQLSKHSTSSETTDLADLENK